jgi:hypothetical protein
VTTQSASDAAIQDKKPATGRLRRAGLLLAQSRPARSASLILVTPLIRLTAMPSLRVLSSRFLVMPVPGRR